MGFGGEWNNTPYTQAHLKQIHAAVDAAIEAKIKFFDHADIYTNGKAELLFGEVLKERPYLRKILLSKVSVGFCLKIMKGAVDMIFPKNG